MSYITKEGLKHLDTYKYKSGGYSKLDNKMNPFWEWVETKVPRVNHLLYSLNITACYRLWLQIPSLLLDSCLWQPLMAQCCFMTPLSQRIFLIGFISSQAYVNLFIKHLMLLMESTQELPKLLHLLVNYLIMVFFYFIFWLSRIKGVIHFQ